MTKGLLLTVLCCAGIVSDLSAQRISGHYVSKAEEDGVIYHTLPCTLFEHPELGELTFDITYKEGADGIATINFTYGAERPAPADSVCFLSGRTRMAGPVTKIYLEPHRKGWKHRYTLRTPVGLLGAFFDPAAEPSVTLHADGGPYLYRVRRSAWRSYAPIGCKIFEMIRVNE